MSTWLGLCANQVKFLLELSLPKIDIDLPIIKKITEFLVVQITQHAVIKISLKMGLPKALLASITMCRGGRFRFQLTGIVFQQV